ncbi:hypothetical protein EC973_002504 [Apophysomyces ossiformis]|uniref:Uncharacterized protein n=1 Tax=Apophysomyces ossiformis TaxID=679940 RepID=A0A8H7BR28_9FUNG|nr:hypothetical protein EC973_002504 [Apophysomyces ossiformis]
MSLDSFHAGKRGFSGNAYHEFNRPNDYYQMYIIIIASVLGGSILVIAMIVGIMLYRRRYNDLAKDKEQNQHCEDDAILEDNQPDTRSERHSASTASTAGNDTTDRDVEDIPLPSWVQHLSSSATPARTTVQTSTSVAERSDTGSVTTGGDQSSRTDPRDSTRRSTRFQEHFDISTLLEHPFMSSSASHSHVDNEQ